MRRCRPTARAVPEVKQERPTPLLRVRHARVAHDVVPSIQGRLHELDPQSALSQGTFQTKVNRMRVKVDYRV